MKNFIMDIEYEDNFEKRQLSNDGWWKNHGYLCYYCKRDMWRKIVGIGRMEERTLKHQPHKVMFASTLEDVQEISLLLS